MCLATPANDVTGKETVALHSTAAILESVDIAQAKSRTMGELLSEESLKAYGYLPLAYEVMQDVGGAAQTVAGIRSHWGDRTWAQPETIAAAACLDESTVRRRHLPKLIKEGYVGMRAITSKVKPANKSQEYFLTLAKCGVAWYRSKWATLPRWAALMLREWSQRAVYAVILQTARSVAVASQHGPLNLDILEVIQGGYARAKFSLSDLQSKTGLARHTVIAAKRYLVDEGWIIRVAAKSSGEELIVNVLKTIPLATLGKAYQTTRKNMFKKSSGKASSSP